MIPRNVAQRAAITDNLIIRTTIGMANATAFRNTANAPVSASLPRQRYAPTKSAVQPIPNPTNVVTRKRLPRMIGIRSNSNLRCTGPRKVMRTTIGIQTIGARAAYLASRRRGDASSRSILSAIPDSRDADSGDEYGLLLSRADSRMSASGRISDDGPANTCRQLGQIPSAVGTTPVLQ